jgi:hypothetical protein
MSHKSLLEKLAQARGANGLDGKTLLSEYTLPQLSDESFRALLGRCNLSQEDTSQLAALRTEAKNNPQLKTQLSDIINEIRSNPVVPDRSPLEEARQRTGNPYLPANYGSPQDLGFKRSK